MHFVSSDHHKIMVVDDEPDLLTMVTLYLKAWCFEVEGFSDPLEALEYFKNNSARVSLVITDIRMPSMTGLELAANILKIKPDAKLMLMTAFDVTSLELNANVPIAKRQDILKKPFRLAEICNGVKKQLQLSTP